MDITSDTFQQIVDLQVELLKVLANRTRLGIIYSLKDVERKPLSELREELDVSKANLSQHLSMLKKAHVIGVSVEGRHSYVYLVSKGIVDACTIVRTMIKERIENQMASFNNMD